MHQQKGLHVPGRHRQEHTWDVNPCQALMRYTGAGKQNLEKPQKFLGGGKCLPMGNQGLDLFCFLLKGDHMKAPTSLLRVVGQNPLGPVAEDNPAPRDGA